MAFLLVGCKWLLRLCLPAVSCKLTASNRQKTKKAINPPLSQDGCPANKLIEQLKPPVRQSGNKEQPTSQRTKQSIVQAIQTSTERSLNCANELINQQIPPYSPIAFLSPCFRGSFLSQQFAASADLAQPNAVARRSCGKFRGQFQHWHHGAHWGRRVSAGKQGE